VQRPVDVGVSLTVQTEEERLTRWEVTSEAGQQVWRPSEAGYSLTAQAENGEPVEGGSYIL